MGATLRCGVWASRCGGFSCCRARGSRCAGFSSCGSRALECRLSSCGAWAYLLCGMWDLPRPGLERMSPALAGGFLTTVPQGSPLHEVLMEKNTVNWKLFLPFPLPNMTRTGDLWKSSLSLGPAGHTVLKYSRLSEVVRCNWLNKNNLVEKY